MNTARVLKRAYLVGAPGGKVNRTRFLHGVSEDLKRVKQFLLSLNGGQWLESEIVILSFAEFSAIRHELQNTYVDCRLIYFSGHGFVNNGNNHLMFQDGWIYDTDLIHPFIPKQEIICDACRNIVDLGRISGITPDAEFENFTGKDLFVRQLYNQWIQDSPDGIQIVHAVPYGYTAGDTNYGGVFTNRLLDAAENEMTAYEDYSFATIKGIVEYLNHPQISKNKANRKPQLTYEEGNLNLPFAVGLPAETREMQPVFNFPEPVSYQQGINWGGLALLALGVTAAASFLDNR